MQKYFKINKYSTFFEIAVNAQQQINNEVIRGFFRNKTARLLFLLFLPYLRNKFTGVVET